MQLRHVFSELRQGLRRNLTMHIAVILTLFVSLTLVGLGFLLNAQAKKAEDHFGTLNQITIFLCNKTSTGPNCTGEVTDAQRDAVIKAVDENPSVDGHHTESQDEAWEKFKELYSEEFLDDIPDTFGPESLRESVWVDLNGRDDAEGVISAVEGLDGVHTVRDQRDLVRPIFKTIDMLKYGAIGIAVFLILAALLLVANTIRLAAFARRREIGIMRLVGASGLYISLPFLLEALVTAVIGVLLASGALALFMGLGVQGAIEQNVNFMPWIDWSDYVRALFVADLDFRLIPFPLPGIVIIGPLLTIIPTLLLTRKYLKV
ncbi:FtsX-like permease family protein [Nocardioides sp. JQ2195]|uniref:permease-like cell division protein FtsX n=1 Tax=Nocardioides sp. JQ2195 TaxID=2592334 RepID=UPI00143E2F83|nr:permease-like cell division protein FtsX [Nocardioides sp. JQ2195]QIX25979.1 FtsX-like permease family protein [Nocardioides sp. JQ2195]